MTNGRLDFGFRQGRSTVDHLVCFENYIHDAFLKKNYVVTVFFNSKKAYKTTRQYIVKDLFDFGLKARLSVGIHNFFK